MSIEKRIDIIVETNKATTNIKNLNKEVANTSKEVKNTANSMSDFSGVADSATGGMISKFSSLTGTLGKVAGGFKSIGLAIAASGIGLLILVVASLTQAFSTSEEGQNKFAKLMAVIGSVVGNVTDVLSNLGMFIIDLFSGDGKAIKTATSFGKKIFDVVGLPVKNIITIVETLAKTLGKLFSGDISGAFDQLKNGVSEIGNNFKDATNAINEGANALKKFGEEALREAKIAQDIADLRAKADKKDRELIVKRAEADRRIAQLREDAVKKDTFSLKQRTAFLKEAQEIEENITNQEIASAKLRRDAIIEENKLSNSNKEALKAEEEAKARVIQLETQRLQSNRRVTQSIQSMIAEEKSTTDALIKSKEALNEAERKIAFEQATELQRIADKVAEEKRVRDAQIAEEDYQAMVEQFDREIALLKQKAEEEKYIDEVLGQSKIDIQNAVINNVSEGIKLLTDLAGENKALQATAIIAENAVGIAKQIIATRAANAAVTAKYALIPGGVALATAERLANNISLGLGIASSAVATSKALSALGKGGGGGGSSAGRDGQAPTAPSFNLVGGTGINQIAQGLGGQQQPIQAYVVSGNVTSAQSLDRNIVNTASVG